jgi:hypothetical protein
MKKHKPIANSSYLIYLIRMAKVSREILKPFFERGNKPLGLQHSYAHTIVSFNSTNWNFLGSIAKTVSDIANKNKATLYQQTLLVNT